MNCKNRFPASLATLPPTRLTRTLATLAYHVLRCETLLRSKVLCISLGFSAGFPVASPPSYSLLFPVTPLAKKPPAQRPSKLKTFFSMGMSTNFSKSVTNSFVIGRSAVQSIGLSSSGFGANNDSRAETQGCLWTFGPDPTVAARKFANKRSSAIAGQSDSSAERRKATRYRMGAPVTFRWTGRDKKRNSGVGTVRDMSMEGVFVLSSICPRIGATVEMEIARPDQRSPRSFIKARMKVLRIDRQDESGVGFAAQGKVFVGGGRGDSGRRAGAQAPFIVTEHRAREMRVSAGRDFACAIKAWAASTSRRNPRISGKHNSSKFVGCRSAQ